MCVVGTGSEIRVEVKYVKRLTFFYELTFTLNVSVNNRSYTLVRRTYLKFADGFSSVLANILCIVTSCYPINSNPQGAIIYDFSTREPSPCYDRSYFYI